MKRLLSILLVAIMIVSVVVLASCNNTQSTAEQTTVAPATEAPKTTAAPVTETTTAQTTETTKAPVTETTKAPVTETTKAPVTETTKAPVTETTAAPVTETTANPGYTGQTTTVPVFARFDFGTDTIAEAEGKTSHEYLMSQLAYNTDCLFIEFKEDSWKIWAISNWDENASMWSPDGGTTNNNKFALAFNNIITYDFDDQLIAGYGGWKNYPYNVGSVNVTWNGYHQYCKVRLINHSTNNIIGFRFRSTKDGSYFTTTIVGTMYLQGTVGSKTASAVSTEYKSYIYDVTFCACIASSRPNGAPFGSYQEFVDYCQTGVAPGNNWTWAIGMEIVALEFNFLGAPSNSETSGVADSRANIKSGNWVEVDYIVFGASFEGLEAYKSNLELAA
jgi:hypothetical protein